MIKTQQFIAFYSLPILVIAIAGLQLYKTETSSLSRWKGGGFGMYTNINEIFNVIVINDSIYSNNYSKNVEPTLINKSKLNLLYNTNDENVALYLSLLNNKNEVKKIQIYEPVFNPEKNTLTYQLGYEKIIHSD